MKTKTKGELNPDGKTSGDASLKTEGQEKKAHNRLLINDNTLSHTKVIPKKHGGVEE